jgi:hypothetical protein
VKGLTTKVCSLNHGSGGFRRLPPPCVDLLDEINRGRYDNLKVGVVGNRNPHGWNGLCPDRLAPAKVVVIGLNRSAFTYIRSECQSTSLDWFKSC